MTHHDSAFAIIRRESRVLLVQARSDRKWKLPGGGLDADETPWHAAVREVKEETGLDARVSRLAGIYRRRNGSLAYVFFASVRPGKIRPEHRSEIRRSKWVPILKASLMLSPRTRRRLLDALGNPATLHLTG